MTSNIGSTDILEGKIDEVKKELNYHFKPEFLNRIDEIITFKPLTKEVIKEIFDKIINDLENRLKDYNLKLIFTDEAKEKLIEGGYDPNYGARPLKRYISKTIETALSKLIIEDKIEYNDVIRVDYKDNEFTYNVVKKDVN